ncbi:MAG: hypothetical protein KDE47_11960 [Caldilineaceae bacterium]|nr:hypothetical protein [Caldilineaceae bacterium]
MEKAKDVADDITERVSASQTAHELAEDLMNGLRMLGQQLDKWTAEFKEDKAAGSPSAAEEQEIPVQDVSAQKE